MKELEEINLPATLTGGQTSDISSEFIFRYRFKSIASFYNYFRSGRKARYADQWLFLVGKMKDHLPADFIPSLFEAHPWLLKEAIALNTKKGNNDNKAQ
jgi:hypothetical protein